MGVIGVTWEHGRADVAKSQFAQACDAFERFKGVSVSARTESHGFAIAYAEPAPHPGTGLNDEDPSFVTAGCGWWYDPEREEPGALADLVEHLRNGSTARLRHLEGQYLLLAGNVQTGEIATYCDTMGAVPVYVAEKDGVSWISTSALVIGKAMGAKLDVASLRALFLRGTILSPRSAFYGVRRLHAGEQAKLEAGRVNVARFWSPFPTTQLAHNSVREAAEHGVELLRKSWRRLQQVWPRILCDLTSGLDSRLIVSIAASTGGDVSTTVFGQRHELDVAIAREISEHFAWPFLPIDTPADWGKRRWEFFRRSVELSDGDMAGSDIDKTLMVKATIAPDFDAATGGSGGEFYRDFFWQQEFLNIGKTSSLNVRRLMDYRFYFGQSPAMELFQRDWRAEFIDSQVQVAEEIAGIEASALNTAKLDALYLWKNSGAFARIGGAVSHIIPAPFALLGRELFEYSSGLDWRLRLRGRLIREMITQAHPELASFRTWYGGSAEPLSLANPTALGQFSLEAFKKLVRKVGNLTIRRPIFPDPCARKPTPEHDLEFIQGLAERGFLEMGNLATADLYDKPALARLLASANIPGFRSHRELYVIVSIEHLCRCAEVDCTEAF